MSDEYEYGPWVGWNGGERPVAASAMVQSCVRRWGEQAIASAGALRWQHSQAAPAADVIAYRIATPKPKRELVVGKWYLDMCGTWRECVLVQGEIAWLRQRPDSPAYTWEADGAARFFNKALTDIDWSTPPRDEAPE